MNLHPTGNVEFSSYPKYQQDADRIMDALRGLSESDLEEALHISPSLAAKAIKLIYTFQDSALLMRAINAFNGVVYKALNPQTFTDSQLKESNHKIRIVSCLYGLLRPSDAIHSYRLDFKMPSPISDSTLASYWKGKTTIALVNAIKDGDHHEVLNLLPADAAKQIDWKVVKKYANVGVALFKELQPGGSMRTPGAAKLKKLRGNMLREIICSNIDSLEDLKSIDNPHFSYLGDDPYPGYYSFLSD